MKNWLFSINILLFFSFFLTCNGGQNKNTDAVMPAPKDSAMMAMDSIKADSITHMQDSLTKEEKYTNHQGGGIEAPKHDAPNQAKIDSIKDAKAKKKKKD